MTALIIMALAGWYCSRLLLYLKFPGSPPETPCAIRLKQWLPRIIGILPPATLGLAFILAAGPYYRAQTKDVWGVLVSYGLVCFTIGALLLFGFCKLRQRLGPARFQDTSWSQLSALRRRIARISVVGSLLIFAALLLFPVTISQFVGSGAILLLAGASWIVYGSLLIYAAHQYRLPVISTIVILAFVFSYWNYNHPVRPLHSASRQEPADFGTQYEAWLAKVHAKYPDEKKPVCIVVAASGGGIRAAVWTATVLGELQDRNPAFADHVFAISGVSGGSLGAAVFNGLLKYPPARSYRHECQRVLSRDFLSPTLAYMLFPDMVQRVLPFPITRFDRARALETAWESGWESVAKNRAFAEDFMSLWHEGDRQNIPSLFLNGTSLETGRRMVLSNVQLPGSFAGVVEVNSHLPNPVRLSTAVDMSTRFSFVSPSGRFKTRYHIVDGGYFENSGTATASDILDEIDFIEADKTNRVTPMVVVISNDPEEAQPRPPGSGFLSEAIEPIGALLSSRQARGFDSELQLKVRMPKSSYYRFSISGSDVPSVEQEMALAGSSISGQDNHASTEVPLPLGWSLSRRAIREMNRILTNRNETAFEVLDRLPRKSPPGR